ncbi:MAG: PSD1 and planctomycete cytochrome C domain-containing protein [Planctomycetaceae bacterium]
MKENTEGTEFFESRIRPLLVKHCYECHSEAEGQKNGGLLLDRSSGWLNGGDSGQTVVPGDVNGSLLIQAVRHASDDLQMPPEEKLDEADIRLLERWIQMGAPGPAVDPGDTQFSTLGDQDLIFQKAASHWAFQPIRQVDPPTAGDPEWNQHPVDRFVFAKLAEQNLMPSKSASVHVLQRRLAYDLTGLPPAADSSQNLDELTETLLQSPHFGEHLARLWLDVVRYADTANVSVPATRPAVPTYYPYAFTYRDYIIRSFNSGKPYDQFLKEQLAADLMGHTDGDPDQAALGFIAVTPFLTNPHDFADDVIDTVSRGLMGLSVACARCHDHKFEPIPTADYYSLHGVFSSITKPDPDDFEQYPIIEGIPATSEQQEDFQAQEAAIQKKITAAEKSGKLIGARRKQSEIIRQSQMATLVTFHPGAPTRAIVVHERSKPVTPQIFLRGEPDTRGDRVPRRFLKLLDPDQKPFPGDNSGRLALAEHIVSPDNPLTARVFVNRIWGMLMGSYLVDTPSDFGLQGSSPSHPELLDWLAADFMNHGWSVRHLIRTIVSSRTYRQTSQSRADAAADPENQLYHRANLKRLSIEQLRDSVLDLSGQLDRRTLGRSEPLWGPEATSRRAVYGLIDRIVTDPTLRAFDFPTPTASADRRTENIVPQQSLFAMNSEFITQQSRHLTNHLLPETQETREDKIALLYRHIYRRSVTPAEQTRITKFLDLLERRRVDPYPLIAQSLMISNEFLYVE